MYFATILIGNPKPRWVEHSWMEVQVVNLSNDMGQPLVQDVGTVILADAYIIYMMPTDVLWYFICLLAYQIFSSLVWCQLKHMTMGLIAVCQSVVGRSVTGRPLQPSSLSEL
ncbi:hypothetical protein ILYODFUR_035708 [Ilyodon furcidens]|uniref:Uncharacterized protein n=1 Tax=Ilyodon furcidens TaxID=33524 RepID=A0ABV0UF99_9TELE